MTELTDRELNERIAILKRFKTLLEQQRNKFREYLKILENQQNSIAEEDPESLFTHTVLEQQVVQNIVTLQKVIDPMNGLYRQFNGIAENEDDRVLSGLKNDLADLQEKVLEQNKKNRDLLRTHLSQIRRQLESFKNPYARTQSIYAQKAPVASLVEIQA
ncbi:flagellar biosynthesis protein FlgN [Treponema parvum]|uniref:Flagellar biosynthesis protein FlgN n=1 Tax=Treponema parvum TaxID=138851 RepID=A0A975F099_9SPIR|nr:flagellar export chaperone FlgN [Treponema parvum]QTQ12215.1 flagellar biosynthesis protein FlgN [Treponema parvum]QTQ15802.1 flagellar biosynthesis protein FlgN [Treponema parvum]